MVKRYKQVGVKEESLKYDEKKNHNTYEKQEESQQPRCDGVKEGFQWMHKQQSTSELDRIKKFCFILFCFVLFCFVLLLMRKCFN